FFVNFAVLVLGGAFLLFGLINILNDFGGVLSFFLFLLFAFFCGGGCFFHWGGLSVGICFLGGGTGLLNCPVVVKHNTP
ncbi:hypothetical protein, partial [Neisseria sp. P0017.S007]|uniref:hypothetical protein n=1 Tax=Neisseria sp. P0017.S007 TaxID=3436783 RepID=UPI003F81F543